MSGITQSGLSSLNVIYYFAQLFRADPEKMIILERYFLIFTGELILSLFKKEIFKAYEP